LPRVWRRTPCQKRICSYWRVWLLHKPSEIVRVTGFLDERAKSVRCEQGFKRWERGASLEMTLRRWCGGEALSRATRRFGRFDTEHSNRSQSYQSLVPPLEMC